MHEQPAHDALNPAPLATSVVGSRVLIFDTVDSTNERALRLGGEGTVVIADYQTAARGRHGRKWDSPAGLGLWFSVVFERPVEGLSFAASLAVRDAIAGAGAAADRSPPSGAGADEPAVALKWPNDVLLGGKKVCGILVERRGERMALGVGLNVHQREEDFPPELRGTATSLDLATGWRHERGPLLRAILTRLDANIAAERAGGGEALFRAWVAACAIRGKSIASGQVRGVVIDVAADGALVVNTPEGSRRIAFGEVTEREPA